MNTFGAAILVQLLLVTPPLATFWLTQRDPESGLSGPGQGVLTWSGLAATALVCVLEWLLIRRERRRRARKGSAPEPGGIGLEGWPRWCGTWWRRRCLVFYRFGGQAWPGLASFAAATALGWGMLMVESWQGRHLGAWGVARKPIPPRRASA